MDEFSDQEIKLIVNAGCEELVIRKGQALPLKEPKILMIKGQIESVKNYLDLRPSLDYTKCRVETVRDEGNMKLIIIYFYNTV